MIPHTDNFDYQPPEYESEEAMLDAVMRRDEEADRKYQEKREGECDEGR